jgi:hypothetical protein
MRKTLATIEEKSENNFSALTANQLKTALEKKLKSKADLEKKLKDTENSKDDAEQALKDERGLKTRYTKQLQDEENAKKWNQKCAKTFLGLFFAAIILAVVVYLAPIIVPALAIASIGAPGVALVGLVCGVAGAHYNYKYTKNEENIEKYKRDINSYNREIEQCEQWIKGCEEEIKKCQLQIEECEEEIQECQLQIEECEEEIQECQLQIEECEEEIQEREKETELRNLGETDLKLNQEIGQEIKGRPRSGSMIVQRNPSSESNQKIEGRPRSESMKSNTNNKNLLY